MIKFEFLFEFLKIFFSSLSLSKFLSHPFVIAVTIFFLSNKALARIIPGKKEKTIEKFVQIKNLLIETEFVHNRIVKTSEDIKKKLEKGENQETSLIIEIFEKNFYTETKRMANIICEKVPVAWFQFNSEIEIYFEDKKLTDALNKYFLELKIVRDFIENKLPDHPDTFQKKLSEIEGLSFDKIKSCEKELIKALRKAKSIKLSNK